MPRPALILGEYEISRGRKAREGPACNLWPAKGQAACSAVLGVFIFILPAGTYRIR